MLRGLIKQPVEKLDANFVKDVSWLQHSKGSSRKKLSNVMKDWQILCSPEHTHTLLFGVFYSSTHFTPWNTLLLGILCSSTHSTPWHILLLSTLIFLEQFAAWNSLLPGTLKNCIKFWSKVFQAENCYRKQSVTRSKVFVSQWNADLNCPAEYESGRVVLALA